MAQVGEVCGAVEVGLTQCLRISRIWPGPSLLGLAARSTRPSLSSGSPCLLRGLWVAHHNSKHRIWCDAAVFNCTCIIWKSLTVKVEILLGWWYSRLKFYSFFKRRECRRRRNVNEQKVFLRGGASDGYGQLPSESSEKGHVDMCTWKMDLHLEVNSFRLPRLSFAEYARNPHVREPLNGMPDLQDQQMKDVSFRAKGSR